MNPRPKTFALETYAARSVEYYRNLVDADGLPYFNVFWTDPPEAVHDWPDFGDVMSRQLQACVMARLMTGQRDEIEGRWLGKVLSYIDPGTGLLTRPKTNFSELTADWGDAALTLYALTTVYMDSPSEPLLRTLGRMVDGIIAMEVPAPMVAGFMIKSLMVAARILGRQDAVEHAGKIVRSLLGPGGYLPPDNRFPRNAHMHLTLRGLTGAADWALHVGDAGTLQRVAALYEFVRTITTRFGFLCEAYQRQGDVIACETCAIMDYLGLAATLANHGYSRYWADVERVARNHLVESQVVDASWLGGCAHPPPDTHQFTWRDIAARLAGAYSGWTSPNHILACRETMIHWGGPEIRGKVRAIQNCCGGSGTHGLFIAWKDAARFDAGVLSVNLHVDKLLPQAEVRCLQPYQGKLAISLREACSDVRVRIPEFVTGIARRPSLAAASRLAESPAATGGGGQGWPPPITEGFRAWAQTFVGTAPLATRTDGDYLRLGPHASGTTLLLEYPLELRTEEIAVGNEGFRQYPYRVTWKGDTVVRMEPLGESQATGFSDFDKGQIATYYGREGPGPLYQREHMIPDQPPELSEIGMDKGAVDCWRIHG